MGWRNDREKRLAYLREYYQRNKAKHHEYNRQRRAEDPEKTRAYTSAQTRSWTIRVKHGMTLEQYDAMVTRQDNRCATCGDKSPGRGRKNWHIDHDHTTLRVRGLLCHRCNVALGLVHDRVDVLANMIQYLQR